ncbi:Ldh family oxidoreductase [Methylobacterium oryzihabitans]|uniref:Ldh family oxidoreductase n=1 Tax=Methylobacterium oryzihabitans TaxID=2499852 RepID=A0A3S2VAK0_9HYPH|nr:Ldh family oxidoreductase [Methylobacterium oryzihabitans]RVU18108.1 Ldh family oxidoreductase [Methylobacterium oryzihabitans]
MPVLSLAEAHALVAEALIRCGTAADNAAPVARALVGAEAAGLPTHGIGRVPSYGAQVRAGKIDGRARPSVDRPRPAIVAVDAGHGFAYPALEAACAALPEVARAEGLAAAPIRRSHHCGAAGLVVESLAAQGLVALLFANAPAAMAPWGGTVPLLGTNPVAFACPLPGRDPIVIDLALSKVARGHIVAAQKRGEPIPEGWALDAAGRPTTDPDAALAGTMVPLGDAKGTALALMVELLAAGLTGGRFAAEASSFLDTTGGPPSVGQLILAVDPGTFAEGAVTRFGLLAEAVESQDGARLPGSRRLAARERARAEGLRIGDGLLAEIAAV